MTVHFQVVKNPQPDCMFCGVWRSMMIRIVRDDTDGEKWICGFCARGIENTIQQVREKENKEDVS